jgi:chaperonin GroES
VAYIQSTRPNDLADVAIKPADPEESGEGIETEEEPEQQEPQPQKHHGSTKSRLVAWIDNENIAREISPGVLATLGQEVVREFDIDENSRAEWKSDAEKALKFATQRAEPKQYPWTDASNIIFPLITRAAIEFAATTYPALIANRNVVKGTVWGDDNGKPSIATDGTPQTGPDGKPVWLVKPGAKTERAARVGTHMSWQLLDMLEYWEWQTDTMLHQLPIVGGAVRKTYRNPTTATNESVLVPLLNLVWNKHAKSFAEAPRHSEIITLQPFQIEEYERADETFLKIIYGVGGSEEDGQDPSDSSAPQEYIEQHRRYDLDNDGYPEPFIVTVHRQSTKVVRIVARYEADDIIEDAGEILRIKPTEHYTLYAFFPDPRGGSYPIGFGHLLKPLNEAINTTLNQMFDAGHLQIAGGGFVGTSLSLHSGPINFQIGEYKPVNNKGSSIRDSVFPIPFPGPNPVLFQLLGFLTQAAEAIASTQNILSADAAGLANMQPTTLLLLVGQGMRTYTAIHKRIYRALKSELNKLYRLNRIYLEDDERFKVGDDWCEVSPEDYRLGGGVEPIADPTMITDMQRLGKAMAIKEFANDPLFQPLEVRRRYLEACQIEKIGDVLVDQLPPPPPQAALDQALAQANIGRARAAELKDQSQAFLNMALARAKASAPEMEWIDKQLELMRLHIESLNTTVKAADVDAKMHGHNTHLQAAQERARQVADERPDTQTPVNGNNPGGIPAMAPPSNQQNPVSLPAGPGSGLPGVGSPALGGGPA